MMEMTISIVALLVSVLSLGVSYAQNHDKNLKVHGVQIPVLEDSFSLLFDGNKKFNLTLVNSNNRDILVLLRDGYVDIAGKKYAVKSKYYVIKANSVTTIEIEISEKTYNRSRKLYKNWILFCYQGLFIKRKCEYKEKS